MQVKDINKVPVLERLLEIESMGRQGTWFQGFDNSVGTAMPEGTPPKLQLAVMKALIKNGLVDGCGCGCRGDFELTQKGRDLIS